MAAWYQLNQKLVNCQVSPLLIIQLSTLKGPSKAPAVDPLSLNTLGGMKTRPEKSLYLYFNLW